MTRGSLRLEHKKACPAHGTKKPAARQCRCSPRVRARLAGRDYTVGYLAKGWVTSDLEPFERKLLDMREMLVEGRNPRPQTVVTLETYAAGWFQNLHAAARMGTISPLTFNTYEGDWRLHIAPFFGSYPLGAIDATLVNRYIADKLEQGYSRNKVMGSLTVLSGMLTDAAAESPPLIPANPLRSPRRGRHGSRRIGVQMDFERKTPKYLELAEAVAVLEAAPDELFDMILCPLTTGFRRMEVAGLQWPDVLFGQQVIELGGQLRWTREREATRAGCKYHSERSVPLFSGLAAALGRRREAEGHLFVLDAGEPFHEKDLRLKLDAVYIAVGLKQPMRKRQRERKERQGDLVRREQGYGWHALRHTYASVLAHAEVPQHVVEELLGHKKRNITVRYQHTLKGAYLQVEEALDAAFGDVVRRRLVRSRRSRPS